MSQFNLRLCHLSSEHDMHPSISLLSIPPFFILVIKPVLLSLRFSKALMVFVSQPLTVSDGTLWRILIVGHGGDSCNFNFRASKGIHCSLFPLYPFLDTGVQL